MLLIFTLLIVRVVNEILTMNRLKRNLSIFKGSPVLVRDILHTYMKKMKPLFKVTFFGLINV